MATLRLDQINVPLRSYDLELSLDVGATLALVGPSGSGKTTILRVVAGLTRPRSGRVAVDDDIWFDGQTGRELPPEQRRVGLGETGHGRWFDVLAPFGPQRPPEVEQTGEPDERSSKAQCSPLGSALPWWRPAGGTAAQRGSR